MNKKKKRGRPRAAKRQSTNVRHTIADKAAVKRIARLRGMSQNEVFRIALAEYIEQHDPALVEDVAALPSPTVDAC